MEINGTELFWESRWRQEREEARNQKVVDFIKVMLPFTLLAFCIEFFLA